ncbi:hypothetical protein QFC21_003243 [Naganishia friedmannii]|uniref:Uncharacterized protein n=1 Tax=Naganishia friedmannii TaxID=89922 RepID=A0ACC2VR68_9TREE|nr:hypothetical protein QFC21_003243 [Naganishia friedmannii]
MAEALQPSITASVPPQQGVASFQLSQQTLTPSNTGSFNSANPVFMPPPAVPIGKGPQSGIHSLLHTMHQTSQPNDVSRNPYSHPMIHGSSYDNSHPGSLPAPSQQMSRARTPHEDATPLPWSPSPQPFLSTETSQPGSNSHISTPSAGTPVCNPGRPKPKKTQASRTAVNSTMRDSQVNPPISQLPSQVSRPSRVESQMPSQAAQASRPTSSSGGQGGKKARATTTRKGLTGSTQSARTATQSTASTPATPSGNAAGASGRDYNRWDKRRESDGLTAEGALVEWLAEEGNWRRWEDAKSTGHKDKCYIAINDHLEEQGFGIRTKDSILSKIRLIEDSFKKALTWINSTGAGASSLEPDEEGDGRSPYQRELDKRCKHYSSLLRSFGERAGMIPKRVYTSMEAQNGREAERDILCALGLAKWDFEEEDEDEGDGDEEEDDVGGIGDNAGTPTPAGRGRSRSRSTSGRSTNGGRNTRSTGLIKSEDIGMYFASKRKTEKRRLDLEERKMRLESKRARLEGIAALVKVGIALEDAKRTWDEDKSESSSSSSSSQEDNESDEDE